VLDQKQIWTSSRHLRSRHRMAVALAGISTGLFMTDSDVSLHLSMFPTHQHYTAFEPGIGAAVGARRCAVSYLAHEHARRPVGGEAALNSLIRLKFSSTDWPGPPASRMGGGIFQEAHLFLGTQCRGVGVPV